MEGATATLAPGSRIEKKKEIIFRHADKVANRPVGHNRQNLEFSIEEIGHNQHKRRAVHHYRHTPSLIMAQNGIRTSVTPLPRRLKIGLSLKNLSINIKESTYHLKSRYFTSACTLRTASGEIDQKPRSSLRPAIRLKPQVGDLIRRKPQVGDGRNGSTNPPREPSTLTPRSGSRYPRKLKPLTPACFQCQNIDQYHHNPDKIKLEELP
jgi:hypothetical protein